MEKREIKGQNQSNAVYEVITDGMGAYNGKNVSKNGAIKAPKRVLKA